MVNATPALRRPFLATCRHHVAPDGVVVIQQTSPSWFDTVEPGESDHGGIMRVIRSVRLDGARVEVEVAYHVGDRTWTHEFDRHTIGEDELAADLASAGLRLDRWLTDDHEWFTAGP